MSEWIELNLPYSMYEYFDTKSLGKYPNLDKRAKKELGFTQADVEVMRDPLPNSTADWEAYEKMHKVLDKIDAALDLAHEPESSEWRNARVSKMLKSKNKDVRAAGAWFVKNVQYKDWEEKQPEVISYNERFIAESEAFAEVVKKKSFSGLGLDNPGTLIEVFHDGETHQYLIGHINNLGGVCNDCKAFDAETAIVKRYKVVWSP